MSSPAGRPALVPRYLTRFQCVGPACEDTCCSGWIVTVDEKTHAKYQRLPSEPVANELRAALRTAEPGRPVPGGAHAWIAPPEGSVDCPMLGGGMCRLQQRYGEELLSDTCASFPRTTRALGGSLSQGLALSCPEAARLALLAPDAFEFSGASVAVRPGGEVKVPLPPGVPHEVANDVRVFCLQVAGSRDVPLWMRLATLGLFCEQLTALLTSGAAARVPAFLADFQAALADPALLGSLEPVPARHAEQAQLFAGLLVRKLGRSTSAHQRRVELEVARGLGATEEQAQVNLESVTAAYARGVQRLPEALAASAPALLDHFVLNELFREAFPFDQGTPQAHFVDLVIRFGVLRLMLAACCTGETLPGATQLVETVQVFCRRFQHDAAFAKEAREAFHARGWDTTARLFGYLRA